MVKIFYSYNVEAHEEVENDINQWLEEHKDVVIENVTPLGNINGFWILVFFRGKNEISQWEYRNEFLAQNKIK
jgi:hypothetical protein